MIKLKEVVGVALLTVALFVLVWHTASVEVELTKLFNGLR